MTDEADFKKQVNRGVAWAGASQAIIAIADMVSLILVGALWVSAEDLGIAMAAMAFYPFLDTAADLGVASALIQRDDHTPERISTVFWFNVMLSIALFIVLLGFGPLVAEIQGEQMIGILISVYGTKLLLQNFYVIPFALLKKQLRFSEIAKLRTIAHLVESVSRPIFAALGYTVWCFTLAALARTVVFAVLVLMTHPFKPKLVFRPKLVKDYVRFGVRSSGSQMLYQLYVNLDYAVVTYFFGPAANGIYTLAYTIVLEPVRTITNVVSDVAFPTFAKLRFDRDRLKEQFVQFTRLNLITVLTFVVLIALIVDDFLFTFYTEGRWTRADLELAADAARILCAVGVLRAVGFLGPPLLDGVGRPELTLRYMVFTAVVVPGGFVLSAWLLGPVFDEGHGFLSVAIAWAVVYPLAFVLLAYLVVVTIGLDLAEFGKRTIGIIGCAAAGLVVGELVALVLPDDVPPLAAVLGIGGAGLVTLLALLARWQGVTPGAVKKALKG